MKIISIIYSVFMILYCLETTFMTLSSDHDMDPVFMSINIISIFIFMSTSYMLYRLYFMHQKPKSLVIHLYIVIVIFSYYFFDIFRNDGSSSNFMYQPLFGVLGGFLILISVNNKLRSRRTSRA